MKIGFVGLGHMGLPMARRLLDEGLELHVYNRTESKSRPLESEGAYKARSAAELTARVDGVLACLADVEASREVFLGENGIVAAAGAGQILVDHSTVDPTTARRIHDAARRKSAEFLDAPVSGGPVGAGTGSLTIMVGGDAAAVDKMRPVFRVMGNNIVHMGGPGSGVSAKLVNQALTGAHSLACCEALLLGARSGLSLEKLIPLIANSWGASKMFARNAPIIVRDELGPSSVPIRNLVKDLEIVIEQARHAGIELAAIGEAHKVYRDAADRGMTSDDIAAIYRLVEARHGENRARSRPEGDPSSSK
ncbi:MAG: NAD(P)-dependent oxidoreductase [Acidobacteriota bacterium]|nr:MAG: NAD(P)-dependent oxidoreductase [Acidobacteriota bacterium]